MFARFCHRCLGLTALALAAGCSGEGAGWEGARIAMNLSRDPSYLRIYLDGQKAEQNTLKKAAMGYSEWKIKEPTGTGPRLRFEITKPEKLGRITMVAISIYQQFQADYSHQAEYTIVAADASSEAQMRPDTDYDLSAPGSAFKLIDVEGKTVRGVTLKPGLKYKLTLTVKADKSETAQIEFKTK